MIEIATCSYGEYRPEMGMPVRTSIGAPKWFPHQMMAWDNVFPQYAFLKLEYDQYLPRYLAKLEQVGVDQLRDDLDFMVSTYSQHMPGPAPTTAVLLCYEKLSKGPDNWCHRTMLADWLTQHMGATVVELGAKPEPPALGLFDL